MFVVSQNLTVVPVVAPASGCGWPTPCLQPRHELLHVSRRRPARGHRRRSITCTIALPTTAASANAQTLAHVLGTADAEAERDRQRRACRMRVTSGSADSATVVPRARDAQPRNGIQEPAAQARSRLRAARRSWSGSREKSDRGRRRSSACMHVADSSIGRSSSSTPSTPASAARSTNRSTPIRNTGLTYVNRTIGARTRARTAATRSSVEDNVAPARSARSDAC